MNTHEQELKRLLTNQAYHPHKHLDVLERRKLLAKSYAETENGIAVLSDFQENISYIYSGKFGEQIGLSKPFLQADSAFEEEVFSCIPPEELLERHILELRFFHFQKALSAQERSYYTMVCPIHFRIPGGKNIPILHRTYYLESLPEGSVWLGLCLYTPFIETGSIAGQIVNNQTGETVLPEMYVSFDKQLLSTREIEVLSLLAKGLSSKQIADTLYISVHTVYRHRQNILEALQVNNTAAAVEIGIRLHLIP